MAGIDDMLALAAAEKAAAAAAPVLNGHGSATPVASQLVGDGGDTTYGLAALADECRKVSSASPGTRNAVLNTAAFKMAGHIANKLLTYDTALFNLTGAASLTGLDAAEIALVLRGGPTGALAAGQAFPRTPVMRYVAEAASVDDYVPSPDPAEHTSWWFRDLATAAAKDDTPSHLARQDGALMFYRGKVNGLIGESESGKTWVALLGVLQALRLGEAVLYLDFEDSASGIVGRLVALGASEDDLSHFAYIDPDETLHIAAQADLTAVLEAHQPALIILDGFNAAMTMLGLDLQSNKDATVFALRLLKPLARTKATVVYIDHLPKNREAQGKGGIGAQAKRAMTTGCALRVEVAVEFGRGMTGRLQLSVDKDRAGHVRAVCGGAKNAGLAVLTSSPDGSEVDLRIEAPDMRPASARGPFRPTNLMEKVSRFLEGIAGGVSGKAIRHGVPGNNDYKQIALATLVAEGYVAQEDGPRRAVLHRSLAPYRDDEGAVAPVAPEWPLSGPGASGEGPDPVAPKTPLRSRGLGGHSGPGGSGPLENGQWPPNQENDEPEPWWQK